MTYFIVLDEAQNPKNSIIAVCKTREEAEKARDNWNSMLAYPSEDIIIIKA